MTDERRYSDTEVAEIFRRASEFQHATRTPLASRDGMTLNALQEIGREVGLSPDLIASAAKSIDARPREETRRFLGLPLGVSRTVQLDRRLTDAEWEALVVDLRETFDARGNLRQDGGFRQWTNGNLQALVEPTEQGDRVRLRTMHGSIRGSLIMGLAMLGFAATWGIAAVFSGAPLQDFAPTATMLGLAGGGFLAAGALRLPTWAHRRRKQMEEVAARVVGDKR